MTKPRGSHNRSSKAKITASSVTHLLESGSIKNMRSAKQFTNDLLIYHWNYYSELARQRSAIQDEIQRSIIQTCIPFEFKYWQRAVKYKYGLHPLSTVGSLNFIGGRFNTGKGVNAEVPFFSGLYIAEDKDTALQEQLGQEKNSRLSPREVALTRPDSESIVSVSGKIDKLFDLRQHENLMPMLKLIKNFELSAELHTFAKKLGLEKPGIVKTTQKLLMTLLTPEWRQFPTSYDIPANSQIFGHLVYMAGIEAILYPSKFTDRLCAVIFPKNFVGTDSYLVLDDETPHEKVPKRLDQNCWRLSEMEAREIIY